MLEVGFGLGDVSCLISVFGLEVELAGLVIVGDGGC